MKNENPVHLRFEHTEALASKKDILLFESNVLRITKFMKRYQIIRRRELILKSKLQKRIRSIKKDLIMINSLLPLQK